MHCANLSAVARQHAGAQYFRTRSLHGHCLYTGKTFLKINLPCMSANADPKSF